MIRGIIFSEELAATFGKFLEIKCSGWVKTQKVKVVRKSPPLNPFFSDLFSGLFHKSMDTSCLNEHFKLTVGAFLGTLHGDPQNQLSIVQMSQPV